MLLAGTTAAGTFAIWVGWTSGIQAVTDSPETYVSMALMVVWALGALQVAVIGTYHTVREA